MRDTPRTDSLAFNEFNGNRDYRADGDLVNSNVARILERELADAHAALSETTRMANVEMDRHKRELAEAVEQLKEARGWLEEPDLKSDDATNLMQRIDAFLRRLEDK